MASNQEISPRVGVSINRAAIALGLTLLVLFVACWAWAAVGMPASHTFVGLFTLAPVGSLTALVSGALCAFMSGLVAGALLAFCYNLTARTNQP